MRSTELDDALLDLQEAIEDFKAKPNEDTMDDVFRVTKVMTLEEAQEKLARWETYRQEMLRLEGSQAKIAADFLGLGAYSDAARCAIMAEGMRFVVGRMPPKD